LLLEVSITVVLFLFAIQLLGASTDALRPVLRRILRRVAASDISALGLSWVASYVLANGSIVAALSLSLFRADLVVTSQLFLMIVGSRLGGAAVVVFIGAFDYLNKEIGTVRESTSLGLLTFLLTHSIYLPAMVLGYAVVPRLESESTAEWTLPQVTGSVPDPFFGTPDAAIDVLGPGLTFLLALGSILFSLQLFDDVLDSIDKRRLRENYVTKLEDKWFSFAVGAVVTGLTTSVAFSIGVIVPLYNRGHIKRREIVPFILGANVGTLTDTLLIAIALDVPVGAATVVVVLVLGLVLSLLALAAFGSYLTVVGRLQTELVDSPGYFAAFLLSLLVVPLGLLLV
jgi:sodium-dependent phosphate cotransporter